MQPAVLMLVLAVAVATQVSAAEKQHVEDWPDDYDGMFRKQAKHYFGPGHDWRWFKAQAIAESGLDPDAKSNSGAVGIMQILPETWSEIQEDNPHLKDITSPRWNIAAGIYYDRVLFKRWDSPPNDRERLLFAFGSYNAGYSRIRKTVKQAQPATTSWVHVEKHVPSQTRHYVRRIRRLMGKK
jgi:soluble lytic murein transglycosylase-like protein